MMLTLKVAGILGLIGIRDVRRVFLWFGCIFNPGRTLFLPAYADVALSEVGPFLRDLAFISLLSSISRSRRFAKLANFVSRMG